MALTDSKCINIEAFDGESRKIESRFLILSNIEPPKHGLILVLEFFRNCSQEVVGILGAEADLFALLPISKLGRICREQLEIQQNSMVAIDCCIPQVSRL